MLRLRGVNFLFFLSFHHSPLSSWSRLSSLAWSSCIHHQVLESGSQTNAPVFQASITQIGAVFPSIKLLQPGMDLCRQMTAFSFTAGEWLQVEVTGNEVRRLAQPPASRPCGVVDKNPDQMGGGGSTSSVITLLVIASSVFSASSPLEKPWSFLIMATDAGRKSRELRDSSNTSKSMAIALCLAEGEGPPCVVHLAFAY